MLISVSPKILGKVCFLYNRGKEYTVYSADLELNFEEKLKQ
jgi:hypothetical protein